MRIGELSRRTGVHERLLRYYEEQGLLHPERRPSGYREYGEGDVDIVRRIRSLLAAGLSTSTIATILPCLRDDGDRLIPTCSDLLADLHRERARITRSITDLQTSLGALDSVITAAPPDVTRRALGVLDGSTPAMSAQADGR
ncbi:MerR family transcriptional regulator [Actinomadura roseirufa]|uniref:MerR family transcriptional regulator n=1 Tax=Actinomadura roseirufa TaxID=2094049 RepID=UPI0010416D49|nr:MerR family transcriptional regulator [Actinomadura roseirufa]